MKKFNLMQIVPALSSGGVEQGTLDLANYIAEKEIRNLIVSNGGRMLSYLNKKYVHHYKLPVHSKNFFIMPFIGRKINTIIKENNINILHIRSRAPAWLIPYIDKKNLITVSTFHNVYGHENIIKKTYNTALSKTDYIVAISKYVKEEIIEHYRINPHKISVINRGVDTKFFDPKIINENELINFLKKNNIPNDKKIILYPGRLTDWKGQLEFLNVVEKIKDERFFFCFAGDDKNLNFKKKIIYEINKKNLQNRCKILGHLNRNDLKLMYHCSDLVVSMPTKPEGFGRTISESLSMKKIILAYNFGGVKNQLENLDDIYKIDSRDHELLIEKIKFVLNSSSDNFEILKSKSRDYVEINFSKKNMLEEYIKFYRNILT
jgi:glycosyltransferase involved in cell wall biosynthesis